MKINELRQQTGKLNIPYILNGANRKYTIWSGPRDDHRLKKEGDENYEEPKSGFSPALIGNSYYSFRGILASGLVNLVEEDSYREDPSNHYDFKGIAVTGGANYLGGCSGMSLSGLVNYIRGDFTGLAISVGFNNLCSCRGLCFAGVENNVGGLSGMAISFLRNYAEINGRVSVQIGAINKIKYYEPLIWDTKYEDLGAFVLQIGLHNTAGDRSSPFINIRGIKSLFRLIKSRKKTKNPKSI